jgi:DNA polymerase III subunit gamma/tau
MVRYSSGTGKHKIYIIDEVHMLTNEAFNALLKTLEEPPAHVIFIFATTEPNKVPATILSRCQRFDFKRITNERIQETLTRLAGPEGITIAPEALWLLARRADGSMRDAVSLLDQAVAFAGTAIEARHIIDMLGLIDQETYITLTDIIIDKKLDQALEFIDQTIARGFDAGMFVEGWLEHFRNLLFVRVVSDRTPIPDLAETYRARYKTQAARAKEPDLVKMIDLVAETAYQAKRSTQPKFLLEMMVARLVQLESNIGLDDLLVRLNNLKNIMLSPGVPGPVTVREMPAAVPPPDEPAPNTPAVGRTAGPATPPPLPPEKGEQMTGDNFMEYWNKVIGTVKEKKRTLGLFLEEGVIAEVNQQEIVLQFDQARKFHAESIKKDKDLIEREIKTIMGKPLQVRCLVQAAPAGGAAAAVTHGPKPNDKEKITKADPMTKQIMEAFGGEIIQ